MVFKTDFTAFKRLKKRLLHQTGKAISDFNMIEEGDRVLVCLSGGKDSYAMLDLLLALQAKAPVRFDLFAVNLDQGHPGFPKRVLPDYLEELGVPYKILEKDTFSIVKSIIPAGKTTCGLCSRLRRGILYTFAERIGAGKIALGHHRDDLIETLFLNMFYNGRIKAMPPKLLSDNGRHIVIRPLAYAKESDLASYAAMREFPIIPCDLCGSQENLKRQKIKRMLAAWQQEEPGRLDVIFSALGTISPSQMADHSLFDFKNLKMARAECDRLSSSEELEPFESPQRLERDERLLPFSV